MSSRRTYRRVNVRNHAPGDDETTIPVILNWLLAEVVYGKSPSIKGTINVDSDNVEVGFGWLAIWVCRYRRIVRVDLV